MKLHNISNGYKIATESRQNTRIDKWNLASSLLHACRRSFSTRLARVPCACFQDPVAAGNIADYCNFVAILRLVAVVIATVDTKGSPTVISATFSQFLHDTTKREEHPLIELPRRWRSLFSIRLESRTFQRETNDSRCSAERNDHNRG